MEHVVVSIALSIFGLTAGSFAGATVWRLRARQLHFDTKNNEKVEASDKQQVAKLQKKSFLNDRSVCLHCGQVLKWYDLVPLVSWLSLGGKCRYCRKPIGWFEPAMELGLAVFFVLSYIFWPTSLISIGDFTHFIIWLVAGVGLAILFAYDMKWFLLPNTVVYPLIGLGMVNAAIVIFESSSPLSAVSSVLVSCAFLSGLYYLIYIFSRQQWVGFGDVKLGFALGLLLADWQLAILALFLANFIGTVILVPFLLSGKVKRQAHIPFGPLLIAGWAIAGLFGSTILQWYVQIVLGA